MIRQMVSDDVFRVADIHRASFPDDLLTKLGQYCLLAQYQWFIRHYPALCVVYEIDREIVAFVAGAAPGYRRTLLKQIAPALLRDMLFHPGVIIRYANRILKVASDYLRPEPQEPKSSSAYTKQEDIVLVREFYLAVIAVSSSHRRQGIGRDLLLTFEDRARSLDGNRISLSVRGDTAPARAAYEGNGWYLSDLSDADAIYKKDI